MRSEDYISTETPAAPPESRDFIGHTVGGKYQVLGFLGRGGMGTVYRVHQVFLDSDMALKLLDSARISDGVPMRRFQQEAKAAHSLNHPSLVKVHDFGLLDTGQPYLVMDMVEGETLADYLKRNGPMPLKDISAVFAQVCFGLSYAHAEKVIHRDIKPGNIMLLKGMRFDTEGSVKIVDFGLAKIGTEGKGVQALTRTGEVMGSPIYMSPEQCSGESIDYRTDVYSLGCVLFEALTGTPPFIGDSSLRTMMLHQSSRTPTLKEASLGKDFPAGLERIVGKMLAKSPNDRYEDLGVVAHELAQVCAGTDRVLEPKRTQSKQPAQTISMTRMQFAVAIALTMFGSVGLTLGAIQLKQLRHQPVAQQPVAQQPTIPTKTVMETFSELKNQSIGKTNAPEPIISNFVNRDGKQIRQLHFPEVSIGRVTDKWSRSLAPKSLPTKMWKIDSDAKQTLEFPADLPLTLEIDLLQVPWATHSLEVYKQIGPNEFAGLKLDNCPDPEPSEEDRKFMLAVLKQAAGWKRLNALEVNYFTIRKAEADAIENLKSIRMFDVFRSTFESKDLAGSRFLQRVEFLNCHDIDFESLTCCLHGSSKIKHIWLADCQCSARSFEYLRACRNLDTIALAQRNLDDDAIDTIAALHQLNNLFISKAPLNASQIKTLLTNNHLRNLYVGPDAFARAKSAGIVDHRLNRLSQLESPVGDFSLGLPGSR